MRQKLPVIRGNVEVHGVLLWAYLQQDVRAWWEEEEHFEFFFMWRVWYEEGEEVLFHQCI